MVLAAEGLWNHVLNFEFVVLVLVAAVNALTLLGVEQLAFVPCLRVIFQQSLTLGEGIGSAWVVLTDFQ